MRHLIVRENDPRPGHSAATHCREYGRGSRVSLHAHRSCQLVYASRGVMEVTSGQSLWVIPPSFGLWIPALTPHQIHMPEHVSMRTVYLRSTLVSISEECSVLHIGSLLRELIVEIVRVGGLRQHNRVECALRDLLVAELKRANTVPVQVTLPADARGLAVAQSVLDDPAAQRSLEARCAAAGVSTRTLERIFLRETGTNFECWRRQVRLVRAIQLMVAGRSVKEAAALVGYQHSSALVRLFRSTFASTPKPWIAALNRDRALLG